MLCEIISVGTELTSGQNLDTNSQWLSRRLAEVGIGVGWHTTIADDLDANLDAIRIATGRAKVVLITGGLGPTQDDLTREVLAKLAGVELYFHEESFRHIQELFAKRGREMPPRNRVQAEFPTGSDPLPNERGTAPGIWMNLRGAYIAAMPGVPNEMYHMFETQVLPRLRQLGLAGGVLLERKINTFGGGESHIEQLLFDLTRRGHVPEVGITASDAVISLRIVARAETTQQALAQIDPIERTIRERLGDLVFGVADEEVGHALLKLLAAKKKSISSAESLTGGTIGAMITAVPGASDWYKGGVIAYTNAVKINLLGVPEELIDRHGVVSAEVAEAMAVGCRRLFKTDIAVSSTGVAGPGDLSPDRPAGYVYTGLAWEGGSAHAQFSWLGTRVEVQRRTARMALDRARRLLLRDHGTV